MLSMPVQPEAHRASPLYVSPDGHEFFALVDSFLGDEDKRLVREAFDLARHEHGNQRRKSGELFFTHPLTVAFYLAEYRFGLKHRINAVDAFWERNYICSNNTPISKIMHYLIG